MKGEGEPSKYNFQARVTRRPLACCCGAFSGAVLLSVYCLTGWQILLLGGLLLFLGLALCLRQHGLMGAVLVAAAVGIGVFWIRFWSVNQLELRWAGRVEPLTLQMLDYPEPSGEGSRVEGAILTKGPLHGIHTSLYIPEPALDGKPGDTVTGYVTLHSAREEPPWQLYHYGNGVFLEGFIQQYTVESRQTPLLLLPRIAAHGLGASLNRLFPPEQAGFLLALTTGNRSGLTEELNQSLTDTGLRHIVAASGLHVSILVNTLFLLPGNRRRKSLILLPLLGLFAAIAGFSPSICRAVMMESVLLLAPILGREEDPMTSLSLALVLILTANPYAAASVGLQLSFAASLGMLVLTPRLRLKQKKKEGLSRKARRILQNSLAATLGANAFTLPLVLYTFGSASLLSPLSNLVILWLLPWLMPLGLLCAALGAICQPLAIPVVMVTSPVAGAVIWLIQTLAGLPHPQMSMNRTVLIWLAIAYWIALLLLAHKLKGKSQWAAAAMLAASLMLCLVPWEHKLPAGALQVDVLDVGQGQCILLTSRDSTVVIDCGSQQHQAASTLTKRMNQLHRTQIDALILTHYDSDHMNGGEKLLEQYPVKQLIVPPPEQEDEAIQAALILQAKSHGTQVTEIRQDTIFTPSSMTLSVTRIGTGSNAGLAILAASGAFDLLVTGDADLEAEAELLERWQLPIIEVLVAGHHGSRYSTGEALLAQARPKAVLISVGENDYGHPAEEVLERCRQAGAQIWRTDESGNLTVRYEPDLE